MRLFILYLILSTFITGFSQSEKRLTFMVESPIGTITPHPEILPDVHLDSNSLVTQLDNAVHLFAHYKIPEGCTYKRLEFYFNANTKSIPFKLIEKTKGLEEWLGWEMDTLLTLGTNILKVKAFDDNNRSIDLPQQRALIYQPDTTIRMDKTDNGVALLIGNDNYGQGWQPLNAPQHDVRYIAAMLRNKGYKVITCFNLTKKGIEDTLKSFKTLVEKDRFKKSLFYYSGHGVEIGNAHYIIPIGCDSAKKTILHNAVEIKAMCDLIILDDCRTQQQSASNKTDKAVLTDRSIIYATQTGKQSYDSEQISRFTKYLLKYILQDINVKTLIDKIKDAMKVEDKQQIPALEGNPFFKI